MNSKNEEVCRILNDNSDILSKVITNEIFNSFPEIKERYGAKGIASTKEDVAHHLTHLTTALCIDDKNLFHDYVKWLKILFVGLELPSKYLTVPLEIISKSSTELLPNQIASKVDEFIQHSLLEFDTLPIEINSYLSQENEYYELSKKYMNSLLLKEKIAAERIITEAIQDSINIKDIYLLVFQPVLYEVGRLWQQNLVSVATEHYFTTVTEFIMSRLYEYIFSTVKNDRQLVATSVNNEQHEVGIRMVSDFFEMNGWHTYYLGADTPNESVIKMIGETSSEVLAVSCSLLPNVQKVAELIYEVRKVFPKDQLKIIVGGHPFNSNDNLMEYVGADGYAATPELAVKEVNKWYQ